MLLIIVLLFVLTWTIIGLYEKNTNAISKSKKRLDGKVAIVTGGTLGMGLEISNDFAHRGAKVIVACPFPEEGERARKLLIHKTGNDKIVFKLLDLSSLKSVREFAADILRSEDRLDILINNAGVGTAGDFQTKDGMNFIMQVNYFGHFLLTLLLLPLMKSTATQEDPARIVNTASVMHYMGRIDFENWNKTGYWFQSQVYGNSKLCLVLFARELTKRLRDSNVMINTVDPGAVGTKIFVNSSNKFLGNFASFMFGILFKSPWEGAQTAIYVALHKKPGTLSGKYFRNCGVSTASSAAYDDKVATRLWHESCQLVKFTDEECNNNNK